MVKKNINMSACVNYRHAASHLKQIYLGIISMIPNVRKNITKSCVNLTMS